MNPGFFSEARKQSFSLSTGDNIDLPVEYYDWTWIYAAYPAPVKNVLKILPSSRIQPILFLPGIALIQVMAFEYRKINGVAPYNEVAVSIPVQYEPSANYPGMPIIHFPLYSPDRYSRLGAYVHRLPVTTQEAYVFGVDIWGFPKSVDEITFQETDQCRRCTMQSNGNGELFFSVRKLGTKHRRIDFHCYSVKNGRLLRTLVQTQGQYGISRIPGGAKLQLGSGPLAKELRALGMASISVGRIYATGLQSMLHAASESLPM